MKKIRYNWLCLLIRQSFFMDRDDENEEPLPPNWLKRYSRIVYRGKEYYYNVLTKQKTWERPKVIRAWKNSNNVMECLNNNDDESIKRWQRLEDEYKKFEEALQEIEKDSDVNSEINESIPKALESVSEVTSSYIDSNDERYKQSISFEKTSSTLEHSINNYTHFNRSESYTSISFGKFDKNVVHNSTMHDCRIQFIRMADEDAIEEVNFIFIYLRIPTHFTHFTNGPNAG